MDLQDAPITSTPIADGFHVATKGPIHLNTGWLERELNKIVGFKPKIVELDLRESEYVSSHGLGVLLGFHKRISDGGGRVRIVAIQKRTFAIFKLSRLDQLLGIVPSAVLE